MAMKYRSRLGISVQIVERNTNRKHCIVLIVEQGRSENDIQRLDMG